jgi:hypothetical protein
MWALILLFLFYFSAVPLVSFALLHTPAAETNIIFFAIRAFLLHVAAERSRLCHLPQYSQYVVACPVMV